VLVIANNWPLLCPASYASSPTADLSPRRWAGKALWKKYVISRLLVRQSGETSQSRCKCNCRSGRSGSLLARPVRTERGRSQPDQRPARTSDQVPEPHKRQCDPVRAKPVTPRRSIDNHRSRYDETRRPASAGSRSLRRVEDDLLAQRALRRSALLSHESKVAYPPTSRHSSITSDRRPSRCVVQSACYFHASLWRDQPSNSPYVVDSNCRVLTMSSNWGCAQASVIRTPSTRSVHLAVCDRASYTQALGPGPGALAAAVRS
jgi:hypothetical protein